MGMIGEVARRSGSRSMADLRWQMAEADSSHSPLPPPISCLLPDLLGLTEGGYNKFPLAAAPTHRREESREHFCPPNCT